MDNLIFRPPLANYLNFLPQFTLGGGAYDYFFSGIKREVLISIIEDEYAKIGKRVLLKHRAKEYFIGSFEKLIELIQETWAEQSWKKSTFIPPITIYQYLPPEITGTVFTVNPTVSDKDKPRVDAGGEITRAQMADIIHSAQIVRHELYFPQQINFIISRGKVYIKDIKPLTMEQDDKFALR